MDQGNFKVAEKYLKGQLWAIIAKLNYKKDFFHTSYNSFKETLSFSVLHGAWSALSFKDEAKCCCLSPSASKQSTRQNVDKSVVHSRVGPTTEMDNFIVPICFHLKIHSRASPFFSFASFLLC